MKQPTWTPQGPHKQTRFYAWSQSVAKSAVERPVSPEQFREKIPLGSMDRRLLSANVVIGVIRAPPHDRQTCAECCRLSCRSCIKLGIIFHGHNHVRDIPECVSRDIHKIEFSLHCGGHSIRIICQFLPDVLLECGAPPTSHLLNLCI